MTFCGLNASLGIDGKPFWTVIWPMTTWLSLRGNLKGHRVKSFQVCRSFTFDMMTPALIFRSLANQLQ